MDNESDRIRMEDASNKTFFRKLSEKHEKSQMSHLNMVGDIFRDATRTTSTKNHLNWDSFGEMLMKKKYSTLVSQTKKNQNHSKRTSYPSN